MSQTTEKDKAKSEGPEETPNLASAVSRLVGIHLAALALAITYLVAILNGVSAPTALLRGAIVFAILFVAGRILGFFVGQTLERILLARPEVSATPERNP